MEIKIEVAHTVPLEEAGRGHICAGVYSDSTLPRKQVVRVAVGLDKDKAFGALIVRDWPVLATRKSQSTNSFVHSPFF
jgi:hypothetical protein